MTKPSLNASFNEQPTPKSELIAVKHIDEATGICTAIGHCDTDGVCQGEWIYFDSEGNVCERVTYKDGDVVLKPSEFIAVTHEREHNREHKPKLK